jgi:hypothetical protein
MIIRSDRLRSYPLALAGLARFAAVGLAVVILLTSCSDGEAASEDRRVNATGYSTEFSIAVPPGWQAASTKLTGRAETELAVGTFKLVPTPNSSCPSRAFEDLGPKDTLIMVWEIGANDDLPGRPKHFTATLDWNSGVICAQFAERGTVGVFSFRERGRGFAVWLVVGDDLPDHRRATAYRILDSLEVRPY